jgi:class 3 adenylate cyclase
MREQINVYRGREVKTTGDGFLVLFDSPTRAVRCALDMVREAAALSTPIRAGIHTGEIETAGDDVRGIAVHVAARLLSLAGAGDILVTATTGELIDGSGITVEDAGAHDLKGLTGARQLLRVVSGARRSAVADA